MSAEIIQYQEDKTVWSHLLKSSSQRSEVENRLGKGVGERERWTEGG